jgi:hypothetical protein
MQMVLASFQKGVMIEDEDMAIVLSHFFMNERCRTPGVLGKPYEQKMSRSRQKR